MEGLGCDPGFAVILRGDLGQVKSAVSLSFRICPVGLIWVLPRGRLCGFLGCGRGLGSVSSQPLHESDPLPRPGAHERAALALGPSCWPLS